jgi:uncharacterized membrane protein
MSAPQRLVLFLGGALGVLMVFLAPGWCAGADEGTHVVRAMAMAHGQLFPHKVDGSLMSDVPTAVTESIRVTLVTGVEGTAPNSVDLVRELFDQHPDWSDARSYDTGPTLASSPVAYAPSAVAMVIPNLLGAPPIVTLWCGRLGDLAVYLALVLLALRLAGAFRWAIAVTAVIPMNLAMASSVSPDALTISSLLLVVALWTRLWRPSDGSGSEDPLFRRTWAIGAMVGGAGVLLALSKPPYFLVLLAIPGLLLVRRSDARVRGASLAAVGATCLGVIVSLMSTSNDYRSAGAGIFGQITFQPEVQQRRLLDEPLAFLGRCITNWFDVLPESIQKWTRQLGIWRSGLPAWAAWVVVLGLIVSVIALDAEDLLGLRRFCRFIFALGSAGIVFALMTSSYLYFDDTVEGVHMTDQIARYSLPLFAMGIMGWAPRWPLRGRALEMLGDRRCRLSMICVMVVAPTVCVVAMILTWWWPGSPGPISEVGLGLSPVRR